MPGDSVRIRGGIGTISQEASRVAERATIQEIRLLGTSTELKSFASRGPFQWELRVSPALDYNQGDQFFVVTIAYEAAIERPADPNAEGSDKEGNSDSNPEEIADISFQFGILFELEREGSDPEISREEVEEYADAAATIVLSPYVREYLHDVTMRMGLPPLVMDILPSFAEVVPGHADDVENDKAASLPLTSSIH
jgi:hypothetical protein